MFKKFAIFFIIPYTFIYSYQNLVSVTTVKDKEMIRFEGNKIYVILQKTLVEEDIEKYRKEFSNYNFKKEMKEKVIIDLSTVEEVDFFGFQFLFFFLEYLKKTIKYNEEQIEIIQNETCENFGEKIGFLKCG